jgi:hypothetical protein
VNGQHGDELVELLQELLAVVESHLAESTYEPDQEPYCAYEIERPSFAITEQGFVRQHASTRYFTQPSWHRALISILDCIKVSAPYAAALDGLRASYPNDQAIQAHLDRLVRYIARLRLSNEIGHDPGAAEEGLRRFLNDLDGVPTSWMAHVRLVGVVVTTPFEIQVGSATVAFRPTTPDDLEKPIPLFSLVHGTGSSERLNVPPTVMEITARLAHASELQQIVEKIIALLRLYAVQSVAFRSYTMSAATIVRSFAGGTLSSGNAEIPHETRIIGCEDAPRLEAFCSVVYGKLLEEFSGLGVHMADYRVIAYQRYCDALLRSRMDEQRIATAIMGLEAIFLLEEDTSEVTYKLKMRSAKVLGHLGHESSAIAAAVAGGYGIRSKYVHGSAMSEKERRKIESVHQGMTGLLRTLLDYLRIAVLFVCTNSSEKRVFVNLIDRAMLEQVSDQQLQDGLRGIRGVLVQGKALPLPVDGEG